MARCVSTQNTPTTGETLLKIKTAAEPDLPAVLHVETEAFGHDKEAKLVDGLLHDPTAEPLLSLLAYEDEEPVGHILFTKVRIVDGENSESTTSAAILAPLAIVPSAQGKGVGGKLIEEGLRLLKERNVALVFVLGHPGYYPRHGFQPAGVLGFDAPYPIPEEHAGACWMVQELCPGVVGGIRGRVVCADALDRPEHWRE